MNLETYKELVFSQTKEPSVAQTKWVKTSKLCMMFVEFRNMDILKYNLWNIANVYGGSDTALVIVHSSENRDAIMEITKDWENVRYEELYDKNIDVNEYSRLFTSVDFWNKFSEYEHVLTNQWDSYLFKRIPEKFFKYDYVGGACGHYFINWHGQLMNICSMTCECPRCLNSEHQFKSKYFDDFPNKFIMLNGGFSLRKVSSMLNFCKEKRWNGEPEDLFFMISNLTRPTREESLEFGVQDFVSENPAGCHQIWVRHTEDYIVKLFEQVK